MSEPVRGLIVTHGGVGAALAAAVRQITGAPEDALGAVSNEGLGPDGILAAIQEACAGGPLVVFTDLPSGSCTFAARKMARSRAETAIVCGVNLPVLLDFVFHREMALPQLVDRLVEKGRGGITGTCVEEAADADRTAPR
jgi:mannose/fructose-specific phosphotransferase system component IIA